jgi:hypothetical protein
VAIHAPVCHRALFYDIERGISLGCPLSPLMGTLFLQTSDERMEQLGLFYLRPVLTDPF